MPTSFRLLALALLVLNTALIDWARAWPPTYGSEFEFGHPSLTEREGAPREEEAGWARMLGEALKKKCRPRICHVEEQWGKWGTEYRVVFADGWWLNVSWDPAVVEIQMKPSTLAQLRKLRARINRYIFQPAESVDLHVTPTAMGHFNFGVRSAFDDDPGLFLKFFVDYANHPELATGVLGYDRANAPTLGDLKPGSREALARIVERFKRGELKTLGEVVRAIAAEVYTNTPDFDNVLHYQAIGLKQVLGMYGPSDRPVELRAVRGQRSAEDFIRLAELIEARIQYLKNSDAPLVYQGKTETEFSPYEAVDRFYIYVAECGLDWRRFRELLPPELVGIEPSGFVRGQMRWKNRRDRRAVRALSDLVESSRYARELYLKAQGRAHTESQRSTCEALLTGA